MILGTIYILRRKQKILENQERLQARYFLIGIILSSIFILTTNLLIPTIFRTSYFSRFGPVFMSFFLSITFFAIVRHRLFGINFIIGKSLTVFVTAIIAYLTFYAVLGFDNFVFGGPYTTTAYLFGVLIAIGFTFSFIDLNKSFDEYIGKHITYSEYDPEEIRRIYLQSSSKELNLESLIQFTFETFKKYFETSDQEIYITDKETKVYHFTIIATTKKN